jgi:ferric-dicitrate binding protein FerR (iron transport regulator)
MSGRAAPEGGAPPEVLDEAIAWAVRLGSGSAGAEVQAACEAWRAADPLHEQAWRQVQSVEEAFRQVPSGTASLAHGALQSAAGLQARGRRRAIRLLGLVAAGGVFGAWLWREAPWLQRTEYLTAIGERRRVVLADGTELSLNTGSEAEVLFSPLRRLIVLRRGELFVRTGADADSLVGRRSFWVHAAQARFEAIGTRFGVRQAGSETRLSMSEGQVAIHAGDAPPVFAQAGDRFVVRANGAAPERAAEAGFEADAWTDGALVARQMRLDAFVAELARYRQAPLACDAEAASLRVSGVFQLGGADPVGRALDALVRTLPVKVVRGAGDALTVVRR